MALRPVPGSTAVIVLAGILGAIWVLVIVTAVIEWVARWTVTDPMPDRSRGALPRDAYR